MTESGEAPSDKPSDLIIEQRVRNRLIEYFELASSFTEQRDYEAAPIVHVPYEVIEQWEDWVPHMDVYLAQSKAYTADELAALERFRVAWARAVDELPDDYPTLETVQAMPVWKELREEAERALTVFARRGKLPEDREAP